jgi:hypothetical protein
MARLRRRCGGPLTGNQARRAERSPPAAIFRCDSGRSAGYISAHCGKPAIVGSGTTGTINRRPRSSPAASSSPGAGTGTERTGGRSKCRRPLFWEQPPQAHCTLPDRPTFLTHGENGGYGCRLRKNLQYGPDGVPGRPGTRAAGGGRREGVLGTGVQRGRTCGARCLSGFPMRRRCLSGD